MRTMLHHAAESASKLFSVVRSALVRYDLDGPARPRAKIFEAYR